MVKGFSTYCILVFILLFTYENLYSYKNVGKGRDFWFAFVNSGFNGKVMICSDKYTTGTVSFPKMGWSRTFTVDSGSYTSVALDEKYYIKSSFPFQVNDFGIRIQTQEPVTVFSSDDSFIGDHTMIFPVDALGSKYIIASYDIGTAQGEPDKDCAFYFVAIQDNTTLEINKQVKYKNLPLIRNLPIYITLNTGQAYLITDEGDLSGSQVTSTDTSKKFAVFAGNFHTKIDSNCTDTTTVMHPVWDQLYPVSMLGREYIVPPFRNRSNGHLVRIISGEDGTSITINDSNRVTLNMGDYLDTILYTVSVVKSNNPVSVTEFSRNKKCFQPKFGQDILGEPTMLQLLPVNKMFSGNLYFRTLLLGPMNEKKYSLTLITKQINKHHIKLDGDTVLYDFTSIKSLPAYAFTTFDIEFGNHSLESETFFFAYHYAFCANSTTYEWDGGYSFSLGAGNDFTSITIEPDNPICMNLPISFMGNGPKDVRFWKWDFGDGFTDYGRASTHLFKAPGKYIVTLTSKIDSTSAEVFDVVQREVVVIPYSNAKILVEKYIICKGETISLGVQQRYSSYFWSTGETNQNIKINKGGNYYVIVTDSSGCVETIPIDIKEFPVIKPSVKIEGAHPFCEGDSVILTTDRDYPGYLWSSGEITRSIAVKYAGLYRVTITDSNGCKGTSDFTQITVYPSPKPFLEGPNSVCKNTEIEYKIGSSAWTKIDWLITGGILTSGSGSSKIKVLWGGYGTGRIIVIQTDTINGCIGMDTLDIIIDSTLKPSITKSARLICEGSSVKLSAPKGYSTYLWSTNDTTDEIEIFQGGAYFLNVTGAGGCSGHSDTVFIKSAKKPQPKISGIARICPGESVTLKLDSRYKAYLWNTGDTTENITVTKSGNYSVTVTDTNDCTGFASFSVQSGDLNYSGVSPINFGRIKIGVPKTRNLTLKNNGTDTIEISRIFVQGLEGNTFSVLNPTLFPFFLLPGKSQDIDIRFDPASEKYFNDSLIFNFMEPCLRTAKSGLIGSGRNLILEVFAFLPDTTGKIGDSTFHIPLKAKLNVTDTALAGMNFDAEVGFNASFFLPESMTGATLLSNDVKNGTRLLRVKGNNITLGNNEILLADFIGRILLGDSKTTGIYLNSMNWSDSSLPVIIKNGSLTINGVCNPTGSVIKTMNVPKIVVSPNPSANELRIEIKEVTGQIEKAVILSSDGKTLKTFANLSGSELFLDSREFSSGTYFIFLKVGESEHISPFVISK